LDNLGSEKSQAGMMPVFGKKRNKLKSRSQEILDIIPKPHKYFLLLFLGDFLQKQFKSNV